MNKPLLLLSFLLLPISITVAYASDATSENPNKDKSFKSSQYLYENCKEALSGKSFGESYCSASLSGFLSGYALAITAIPAYPMDDPCRDEKFSVVHEFQNRLCVPERVSKEELGSAFVKFIEDSKFDAEREKLAQIDESRSLIGFFNTVYHCDVVNKRKGN